MRRTLLAIAVPVSLLLLACGGDDGEAVATTTTVETAQPAPTCEEWLSRPVRADEVRAGCRVLLDGPIGEIQAGMPLIECDDGRELYFGDPGWGYLGKPMRLPDAAALSAAQEACPVVFPPGPTVPPLSTYPDPSG